MSETNGETKLETNTPTPLRRKRRVKILSQGLRAEEVSAEARKQAACVLEVLAGVRAPEDAARALGLTLQTYYNVEARALRGLIHGCAPVAPGRPGGAGGAMVMAKKLRGAELRAAALEKQVQRYQALLRAAQRSMGLPAPPPTAASARPGAKRKPKRPTARALRAVEALRAFEPAAPGTAPPSAPLEPVTSGQELGAALA